MSTSNTSVSYDAFQARVLQDVSRSFALTIPQLPERLARTVANAYLMCRIADTIEDDAGLTMRQKQHYFQEFERVLNGEVPAPQFADALSPLLTDSTLEAEHDLIRHTPTVVEIFMALNERQQAEIKNCVKTMSYGMLQFQEMQNPEGLETLAQMNDYCYYVAGVVGEMLTGLFCDYSDQIEQRRDKMMSLAASFGQGLQMTNIIKDIWEDKRRDACWFPKDVFRQAGFDLATLRAGNHDPAFGQGLQTLIGIAHGHLQNALAYTQQVPSHETGIRKFCFWAVGLALATLQKINSTPDYTCARDVTISRAATRRMIMAANASIRSNLLLKLLFQTTAYGLPVPDTEVVSTPPVMAPTFADPSPDTLHDPGQ
jgi:farnesyl-diphosphate farnesyltransferase